MRRASVTSSQQGWRAEQAKKELEVGLWVRTWGYYIRARLLTSYVTSASYRAFLGLSSPVCQMGAVAGPSRII